MVVIALIGLTIVMGIMFMAMNLTLRKVFLYIFATLGLVLTVVGTIQLVNLGLKTYVFTKTDYCYEVEALPVTEEEKAKGTTSEMTEERAKKLCEERTTSEKQRTAATAISLLIVGVPLYLYHWNTIRRDKEV